MSRVSPMLLIVVGAQRIDCGVMVGDAWRPESVRSIPFEPRMEGLLGGLRQLIELQSVPMASLAANELGKPVVDAGSASENLGEKKQSAITQIRVLISEAWLPTISVPWNPACMTDATAQAYAQVHLRAAGFEFSGADEIRLDDAPYGQPRVVVAYPAVLLEALANLAMQMKARLVSVLPLGLISGMSTQQQSLAASGARQKDFALALIEKEQVTFVRFADGQLLHLISRSLRHSTGEESYLQSATAAVWAQWQRIQLRDARAAAIQHLHVLQLEQFVTAVGEDNDGVIEVSLPPDPILEAITPTPRALQLARLAAESRHPLAARTHVQRPQMPLSHRMLAGAVLMVAAVSLFAMWRTDHETKMLQQRARAVAGLTQPDKRPGTLSGEQKNRIVAVNAAIRQLNMPVAALLHALQPPGDIRVALLGVDLAGQGQTGTATGKPISTLRITAEARTGEEMASYVAFLSDRRPFVAAYLVRHEVMETEAEKPYRFTAEAVWQE